jgi:hypothetical protein
MLSALSEARADFLLVGAYAMAVHGFPRATGDLDIWVRADSDNARKVLYSLAVFGATLDDLTVKVGAGSDKRTRQITTVELTGSILEPLVKQRLAAFKGCAVVIFVQSADHPDRHQPTCFL